MTQINQNSNESRHRTFFLVLPILALPFIVLLFWAMGGGKSAQGQTSALTNGLNTRLPGAKLKNDSTENKLSFYQQAESDSLKNKQARKDDPYYKENVGSIITDSIKRFDSGNGITNSGFAGKPIYTANTLRTSGASLSNNEQIINEKLAALKKQVDQPAAPLQESDAIRNTDSENLKLRTAARNTDVNTPDPDMQQISTMLDKIQEIQNPALVRQKLKEQSAKNRGQVFALSTERKENLISTLDDKFYGSSKSQYSQNDFFTIENTAPIDSQNTVAAVIHETQTLVAGSTVKLRLTNDVYINGMLIPKDNFVFGVASLNGERLTIKISSVRYHNSIYPVDLSVYDMDGAEGVYIPGAIYPGCS
jgi:conjugative transposon TraM protein